MLFCFNIVNFAYNYNHIITMNMNNANNYKLFQAIKSIVTIFLQACPHGTV